MLSILIPVYNFDVRDFIGQLHEQATKSGKEFEILCFDDDSSEESKELNREIASKSNVEYRELPENIGRSKIRNMLADHAKYDNLLFLDCDSKLTDSQFIQKYLLNCNKNSVICGGRIYEPDPPADRERFFRWYYGVHRESIPVRKRKEHPYKSFMTNNFLIPKHIFNKLRFNEELIGYGHEDTLFGQRLKEHRVAIIHIDNPLCHIGLETLGEFLKKTNEAIKNLSFLLNNHVLLSDVKILNYYKAARKLGIIPVIFSIYTRQKKNILMNLSSQSPNLTLFDVYKIGYLISLNRVN